MLFFVLLTIKKIINRGYSFFIIVDNYFNNFAFFFCFLGYFKNNNDICTVLSLLFDKFASNVWKQ
jgi:hypothetical protein